MKDGKYPKYMRFVDSMIAKSIEAAAKRTYLALTDEMQKVAEKAGMGKEFEDAEATGYNLRPMLDGKTPDDSRLSAPKEGWDWVSGIHEWQAKTLAEKKNA